jgi:hypothetical protein
METMSKRKTITPQNHPTVCTSVTEAGFFPLSRKFCEKDATR